MKIFSKASKNIMLILICVCLRNLNAYAQDASFETISSILQLPKGFNLEDHVYKDINQDGLKDMILSVSNKENSFERLLRIYYQQNNNPAFKLEADEIITLTNDVISFACADTDQNPGAEILLFTSNSCFAYKLNQENDNKIYKIADFNFLWQIPDSKKAFSWQNAVLDLNNDNRLDIVIPQADGIKILFQKDFEFISSALLEIPTSNISSDSNTGFNQNRSRSNMSIGFTNRSNLFTTKEENKPLVNVRHSINVPVLIDSDGDHLYDIAIHESNYLYLWKQEKNGPFFYNENKTLNISQVSDENSESNNSDNQYILDLNGDKYFDYMLFKRDNTSKKIFTQILIYLNQKSSDSNDLEFDEQGVPQQLIKIAGLPGNAQFDDINNDGYPDLSFMIFNPDLLDQVETLSSKSIKLQYLSFLNDKKGRFSRNPDISHEFNVSLEEQNQYGIEPIQFMIDYNKDQLLDVLVRDKNNHIGLRLLKKARNSIEILDKNIWDMTIPENARIIYEKTNNKIKDVLIITSPEQVIYVRFK